MQRSTPWRVIAKEGDPIFLRGYGEASVAIGPRTVFHVPSIAKQFAAFAIQLLAERGILSLDDDIRTHLPWVPDLGSTTTIRHLLHHTHGFPGQLPRLKFAGWAGTTCTCSGTCSIWCGDSSGCSPSRAANTCTRTRGYELLVEIVQTSTEETIGAWSETNIFQPRLVVVGAPPQVA